ncbi:MAG: DUF2156 domain-containing protein [Fusobacteriaceae bacterium]
MWKNIDISSKEIITKYTKGLFEICDYNFVNLLTWSEGDNIQYKIENNILYMKGNYLGESSYFFPISLNSCEEDINIAIEEILEEGYNIELIPEEWKDKLEDKYYFEEQRPTFDYIYLMEEIAFLKGRKYIKKRNKINQFIKNNVFKYEEINENNIDLVKAFQESWMLEKDGYNIDELKKENIGIKTILENYFELNLCGGVIFVNNKIIAYTIGEKIKNQLFVYIEKADESYSGSYQGINAFFLQENNDGILTVNREDDAGLDGLRQAKESYFPYKLLKKYRIISKK